jgi:hypothetical protein
MSIEILLAILAFIVVALAGLAHSRYARFSAASRAQEAKEKLLQMENEGKLILGFILVSGNINNPVGMIINEDEGEVFHVKHEITPMFSSREDAENFIRFLKLTTGGIPVNTRVQTVLIGEVELTEPANEPASGETQQPLNPDKSMN